jgi:hypothetical protein
MSNQLTPQLADLAIQFMSRVSLQGNEVNAYVAVRQALESVVNAEPVVTEVPDEPDMKLK